MKKFNEVPMAQEIKEGEIKPETKNILYFLRHEEKGKAAEGQNDNEVELTPIGKRKANKQGIENKPKGATLAFGSPRIRSGDTAGRRAFASKTELPEELSFEEAKNKVNKDLRYGSRIGELSELNFNDTEGEFNDKFLDAFKQGKTLDFLVKESDDLAKDLKDKESLSYSRIAANFASLIGREMSVGNSFNRLVAKDGEKYKEYGNQLERYFGNHQSVLECFYMKALQKVYGPEKVVEFLDKLREKYGNTKGFDFQEGFKVEITNNSEGQKVVLQGIYGFEDIELTPELLREIINDAVQLDREIDKPKE
jgi:hypothetical protein